MTIVTEPCQLCGSSLRPYYLNLEEMIYLCSEPKCPYPLMSPSLSRFIGGQTDDVGSGAIGELSQDPFFAEMFGTSGSSSKLSNSLPPSRALTPPYSGASVSISSEGEEEFTHISLISSALIAVLCVRAVENNLPKSGSLIGSIFEEIFKCAGSNVVTPSSCAAKLFQSVSEKIVVSRPNDTNVPISLRLNQLITRLLTDAQTVLSSFKTETSTTSECDICGFSQSWNSQAPSFQLKSFTAHDNMSNFSYYDSCSECGGTSRKSITTLKRLSDAFVMCCLEKASQDMNISSSSPFVDFERWDGEKTSRYALTAVVKYDDHVRRIVVALRQSSESPITDVNNWLRYDSLESFLCGHSSNPSSVEWLTSLPLIMIWQRVDERPWNLLELNLVSTIRSAVSFSAPVAEKPPVVSAASAASSYTRSCSSFAKALSQKFVVSPPVAMLKMPSLAVPSTSRAPKTLYDMTPSNSQFLQKSLEKLSAHRRRMVEVKRLHKPYEGRNSSSPASKPPSSQYELLF